jgi:hypothetical protein
MANTVDVVILENGDKNFIVQANIAGDGSGDLAAQIIADVAQHLSANLRILSVKAVFSGFSGYLRWDGATPKQAVAISKDNPVDLCFCKTSGLQNNAVTPTGSISLTTSGLVANGWGTIILACRKV